jgi:hypothetical protein
MRQVVARLISAAPSTIRDRVGAAARRRLGRAVHSPIAMGWSNLVAGQQVASAMPHERHPYPCQRAYGNFRRHILKFLTKPGQSRLFDGIQRTVMVGFLLLNMPVRWLMDLFDAVSGNRGYLAVGSSEKGGRGGVPDRWSSSTALGQYRPPTRYLDFQPGGLLPEHSGFARR